MKRNGLLLTLGKIPCPFKMIFFTKEEFPSLEDCVCCRSFPDTLITVVLVSTDMLLSVRCGDKKAVEIEMSSPYEKDHMQMRNIKSSIIRTCVASYHPDLFTQINKNWDSKNSIKHRWLSTCSAKKPCSNSPYPTNCQSISFPRYRGNNYFVLFFLSFFEYLKCHHEVLIWAIKSSFIMQHPSCSQRSRS